VWSSAARSTPGRTRGDTHFFMTRRPVTGFSRNGAMRTSPERYATRPEAERALRKMADDGRADWTQDRRFRCLVLLTTFASLRWVRQPRSAVRTST
jgi:hypothetical protein